MQIRKFTDKDIKSMVEIWNQIVENGIAFPQIELLDEKSGAKFFASQSFAGVAVDTDENGNENGKILGLYILHPNNVGRCGHIANASYGVAQSAMGKGVGEALVLDSLEIALKFGFKIMQFNAVVASNEKALKLYEKLGFTRLGVIKGGFLMKNGEYADIIPHYKALS